MKQGQRPGSETQCQRGGSWLVTVLASAAVLALCLGVLIAGCGSNTSEEPSQQVQTMLQERWKGMSVGDTQTVAKAFATNAVLDNYVDGGNYQGSTAIAEYFGGVLEEYQMQWIADGDPIQYDKYVIQRIHNTQLNGTGDGRAIHIMEIDASGQVVHEWIVGWAKG